MKKLKYYVAPGIWKMYSLTVCTQSDLVYEILSYYLLGIVAPSAASTVSIYCVGIVSTSSILSTVMEPVTLLMPKLPA